MNWQKLPRKFGVNPLAPKNGQVKKVNSKNGIGNFRDLRVFDFGLILKSKTWKTRKYFQYLQIPKNVFYLRKLDISEVFEFSILALILKSKTHKTQKYLYTTLVNSKECVLHEEIGNFQGFQVFDFGPYTEIKNSKNLEILC